MKDYEQKCQAANSNVFALTSLSALKYAKYQFTNLYSNCICRTWQKKSYSLNQEDHHREKIFRVDDNPPIGILLCTQKARLPDGQGKKLVEYALSGMDEKLFVSKYLLQLPSCKEVLQNFIENEMKKHTK